MRVLATFASAFALGVFLTQYLLPQSSLLPGAAALAALTVLLCLVLRGERRLRSALLCAGLALALGHTALYIQTVRQPMLSLAGTEQTVTMTLCGYAEETDWGAKATVQLPGFSRGKAVYYGEKSLLDLAPARR